MKLLKKLKIGAVNYKVITRRKQTEDDNVGYHDGRKSLIMISTNSYGDERTTNSILETILHENRISHINYLSVDVEGAEFEVIKSINFDKVFIDVIGFENNYHDVSVPIIKYLENKGFMLIHSSLDIFMINKTSVFINR